MQMMLMCVDGDRSGRSVSLRPDRPLRMHVRSNGQISGSLEITCDADGLWLLSNQSQIPSQVNGIPTQHAVLRPGDRLSYGCHEFELRAHADRTEDRTDTDQILDLGDALSPMEAAEAASREEGGETIPVLEDGRSPPRRRRNSRRLSASRKAVIFKEQRRTGFLQRVVGQAFRRRTGRRSELADLESERDVLVRHAGRWCLEHQGGIGLPDGCLGALIGGQTVTLRSDHLVAPEWERFQALHQRLRQLDAQILSLRSALGMAPDHSDCTHQPLLQSAGHEERAFQALDEVMTDDLCTDIDDETDEASQAVTRVLRAAEVAAQRRHAAG